MDSVAKLIGALAMDALLCELAATPKPGLVDRANNGAHRDMDFYTFAHSSAALGPAFVDFAECGRRWAAEGSDLSAEQAPKLFAALREIGLEGERLMFAATKGINTHKGEVFLLGLLSAAAGYVSPKGGMSAKPVVSAAAAICSGLCERKFSKALAKTRGEKMFWRYNTTGVVGEAEHGFPSVVEGSLPVYRVLRKAGHVSLNDALCTTLLHLIAHTSDTNILGRHDLATLRYAQQAAQGALDQGTMLAIARLDEQFIQRNISPGGSADLLAATHFLYELETRPWPT